MTSEEKNKQLDNTLSYFVKALSELPDRAKGICLLAYGKHYEYWGDDGNVCDEVETLYECCQSPIESIFGACLLFKVNELAHMLHIKDLEYICTSIEPQACITVDGKDYIADFLFRSDMINNLSNFLYCNNELNLVIECDGHDYHTSKQQVKHDNERDLALKKAGYDILHFSGSQIYNDGFRQAAQVISYIIKKSGMVHDIGTVIEIMEDCAKADEKRQ